MTVYITGAGGFLGKNLIALLLKKGIKVKALLLPHENIEDQDSLTVVRGDITRPETLRGTLNGVNAVIHLAGVVGYGVKMNACRRVNAEGTRNLVEVALNERVERFIHLSSVSVYGREYNKEINENFPFKITGDPYGDTKIEAEKILKDLEQKENLKLTILRPVVMYGPGDDKFLPKLFENIKSGKAKIIGNGLNRVDLIHVCDVARAIKCCLENSKSIGETYNLNNEENGNWNDFLNLVSNLLGIKSKLNHIPYNLAYIIAGIMELGSRITKKPPRLTKYAVKVVGRPYFYKTDKIQDHLNFKPEISIKQGLQKIIES